MRRIARDADLAIVAGAGDEQQGELVAVVLRDAAGGQDVPARPARVIERVGMLRKLHFVVDARRIEHALGRRRVRARERLGVGRLAELEKGAGQAGLLEHPVAAVRLRVVLALPLSVVRRTSFVPVA